MLIREGGSTVTLEGYTVENRATGEVTVGTATLPDEGTAIIEVKTGGATESVNQTAVYDACQIGNGAGCGVNAFNAGYQGRTAPSTIYTISPKEE